MKLDELSTNHHEAGSKMILHAKYIYQKLEYCY